MFAIKNGNNLIFTIPLKYLGCNSQWSYSNAKTLRNETTLAIVMIVSPDLVNTSIARLSVANKQDYARRHHYDFILDTTIDPTRSGLWARVITLHAAMHSRPDIQWFWYLDMDAFILEKQIDIYDQVLKKYQWVVHQGQMIQKDLLISEYCTKPDSFNSGCEQ